MRAGARGRALKPACAVQVQQAREVAKSEHAKAQTAMARLSENGKPSRSQAHA